MNQDQQEQLAARITQELRSLGELPAPVGLATRILQTIEQRAAAPWYQRAWQTWPRAGQMAALAVLLGLFGGLCYASWQITHGESLASVLSPLTAVVADLGVLWQTLIVLGLAVGEVVRSFNPILVTALAGVVFLSYAVCAALGTACVRFALARR